MARRRRRKNSNGFGALVVMGVCFIMAVVGEVMKFINDNMNTVIVFGFIVFVIFVIATIITCTINKQRRELLSEILTELKLETIESQLKKYDDQIIVKSRQTLDNYSDLRDKHCPVITLSSISAMSSRYWLQLPDIHHWIWQTVHGSKLFREPHPDQ